MRCSRYFTKELESLRATLRVPDLLPAAGLKGRDGLVTEEMGLMDFQDSSFIEIEVLDHDI